ncbi:MAG: tetratricopeptide repeat protein [bacterium]
MLKYSWMILGIFLAAWLGLALQAPAPCREGTEAYQNREYGRAESLFKQCLAENPEEIGAYLELCGFYQSMSRQDNLYAIASKGLERFPEEKRFYLTVGTGAGRQEDYDRAIKVLSQGMKKWPEDTRFQRVLVQAYLSRGMGFLDDGDNEAAEDDLRKTLQLDPDNTEAMLNLGRALHNLQHSGQALELFDRVKKLKPSAPFIEFNRGVALNGLGRFDEVIASMNRQLLLTPEYAECHYFRGLAFLNLGEWDRARADLTIAVTGMPNFHEAIYRLGRCYLHFGQLEKAEAAFRSSAALKPSDTRSIYALGRVLQQTGRIEEAKQLFKEAEDRFIHDELETGGIPFGSTRKDGPDG